MAIYLVVPLDQDTSKFKPALLSVVEDKHAVYELSRGGFLVQYAGTTQELCEASGITKKGEVGSSVGSALVTVIGSYWGYGNADMWEWLQGRWGK